MAGVLVVYHVLWYFSINDKLKSTFCGLEHS
ncbi:hypothetical protein COLO4_27460 [Corchorus olitorius]|uniref:Uncharacterized protein n=1 Tax=Corchorus olitorius TaxID=93759 RepID=A0A1R3HR28_9ROSI|nr:hypothetical protein COLO4_27460 [Corchorus olitorius]